MVRYLCKHYYPHTMKIVTILAFVDIVKIVILSQHRKIQKIVFMGTSYRTVKMLLTVALHSTQRNPMVV